MHEGLAALFAYRQAQLGPITFTLAANDYGFEPLSPDAARLEEVLEAGLVSPDHLLHDTRPVSTRPNWPNASSGR